MRCVSHNQRPQAHSEQGASDPWALAERAAEGAASESSKTGPHANVIDTIDIITYYIETTDTIDTIDTMDIIDIKEILDSLIL